MSVLNGPGLGRTLATALRRALRISLVAALVAVAVLGVEIELARFGRRVPGPPPGVEWCVNCDPGAPQEPLPMVWLGDSTAAGVGATTADATLPRQVAARVGRPVQLTVLARAGARVRDVVEEQLPRARGLRPELVIVSVGSNDTTHLTGVGTYRQQWSRMVVPRGSVLIALGIPDMGSPPRLAQPLRALVGWRGRRLDDQGARRLAEHELATYVDIAGDTGPAFRDEPGRYFARDRYHPSDEGYGLWAEAVLRHIG
ncbi:MAG TPA: SGNH/GDSL hydrolase family protein [Acidimicrobiales bacterium]|nr:SGNH/GDSL hydrolase family protein [Acidimicrobiales bacterium]